MGQLLFQYLFNPILETVNQFQYHWEATTEYGLRYQRYAAPSDASIFDSPVAITKVATGVSRIQDLFVDKVAHPVNYLHDIAIQKAQKDTNVSSLMPLKYLGNNPSMYSVGLNGMKRTILPSLFEQFFIYNSRYDDGLIYPNGLSQEYYYWALRENHIFVDSTLLIKDYTWKHGSRFSDEDIWAEREWNLKEYQDLTWLVKPDMIPNLNLFEVLCGKTHINQLNVFKDIFLWTHGLVLNEYPSIVLKRINDDILGKLQIHYILHRTEAGWDVYADEFLRYRDRTQFNILENILATPALKNTYSEYHQAFGKLTPKAPKWLENVHAASIPPDLNWYEGISGKRDSDGFYFAYDLWGYNPLYGQTQYESLSGKLPIKQTGYLTEFLHGLRDIQSDLYENTYCHGRDDLITSYFDFYSVAPQNRVLNAFQTLSGPKTRSYTSVYSRVLMGAKQRDKAIIERSVSHAFKDNHITSKYYNVFGGQPSERNRGLTLGKTIWGLKSIQPIYELDLNNFGIRQKKHIFTIDDIPMFSIEESISLGNTLSLYRVSKDVMMNWTMKQDSIAMGHRRENKWDMLPEFWVDKRPYDISLDDYFLLGGVNSVNGKQAWHQDSIFGEKTDKDVVWFHQLWGDISDKRLDYTLLKDEFGSLDRKGVSDFQNEFGSLSRRGVSDFDNESPVFGEKIYHFGDSINEYIISGPKIPKDFDIQDLGAITHKSEYEFNPKDNSVSGPKIPKDFVIEDSSTIIHKESKEMYFEIAYLWFAYKIPKDFVILPWDLIPHKIAKDMQIQDLAVAIHKEPKEIPDTDLVVSAIKDAFSFVVTSSSHPPKWEEVGGFIVPVSKVRKGLMNREIDEMAKKVFKFAFETNEIFGSVIPTDTGVPAEDGIVWFDKFPHKVFLDYEAEAIIKSKVYGAVHNDPIMGPKQEHKGMLEDGVWTWKGDKLLQVQPQVWTSKAHHQSGISIDDIWASQGIKHLYAFEQESAFKDIKLGAIFDVVGGATKEIANANVFQEYWLEKMPNLCYYSYGQWLSKENPNLVANLDDFAFRDKKKAMLTFTSPFIKSELHAWYDEYYFGDKIVREGQLAAEIEWLEKTRRKCGIHPNDFGNWAWVYESPDPFGKDPFGIDELLLPENDTHYENFEDLIFDKDYMRPRSPIKEISDTQWIAKYPIRHPTQKWADVAVDYDASAIDWENYYGIETSVMHDMFLRYYRIWQAKMFEFSTMTMQQAVNLMLEYLWAWIPEYFPIGQLEEAYRVFKLIRWFGEAAVINNSQYIISYEYDNGGMKVKTEKRTGKKLPWDIYGVETDLKDHHGGPNDTMFIDRKQYVIRNNPIYVGSGPAWVEFSFTAKRNTTISFTLMNTIGSVNIYVDGELKEIRSTTSRVIIPIQYTGFEVVVRVEKTKANNLNNQFMIGNLIVPEQDFKDLAIEFDPQLRAGNKPLNEIAQKLIAYAMLHDQRDKAWDAALKANLGVSEVYKKMTRYWNDHHEGKIKGKRLTIKQV